MQKKREPAAAADLLNAKSGIDFQDEYWKTDGAFGRRGEVHRLCISLETLSDSARLTFGVTGSRFSSGSRSPCSLA
jgi:hypothetical protein